MHQTTQLLPMGIQSFEKLRDRNCIYVDKTAYVYRLVHDAAPFFLSRPRRFGKSLLLSTLKAYWEGRKDLFKGLAIEELEADDPDAWKAYPVFYFDLNGADYTQESALENTLEAHLERWETQYHCTGNQSTLEARFENLLIKAHEQTGLRCVVLVDEYDKPLLDLIHKPEMQEHNKSLFKGFFSNLKSCDAHIRFVFITGVTKFHKVSIFSDLNHLIDISLNKDFAAICGITEEEMRTYFPAQIEKLADELNLSLEDCLDRLKQQYDGYHFYPHAEGVYNPFSLINAFYAREFGAYWFETGTPTFLIQQLKKNEFEPHRFTDHTLYASATSLKDYSADNPDPIPLLYQAGYLTIVDYDADKKVLTALFARITYTTNEAPFEHYFQTVIYLVFTLLGKYALCEMHTFTGRIDCKVETAKFIYLFEFKRDETAEQALQQIEDRSYALPFTADDRKLYKIGVSFDSETRMLADWKVVEG